MIQFEVQGIPRPQGSMRAFNGHIVHNKSAELMAWRAWIAECARKAGCTPIDSPIEISMTFRVAKPKSIKRTFPTVAPDLDKYIRAVLDSLSKVAYIDDSQVISIIAQKLYSDTPGVDITISDAFDCL